MSAQCSASHNRRPKGGCGRTGDRRARGAAVKVSAGEIGLLCPERTHGPSIFGQEPLQPVIRGEIRQKCTRVHTLVELACVDSGDSCVFRHFHRESLPPSDDREALRIDVIPGCLLYNSDAADDREA